jgi:hypothetical protein
MKFTWLGHPVLKISGSRIVFVGPFPSGCPKARPSIPGEI